MNENPAESSPNELPPTIITTRPPAQPSESVVPQTQAPPPGGSSPIPVEFVDTLPMPLSQGGSAEPLPTRNYRLLEELGHGAMGVVYRAVQVGLNRHVALKMILSGEYARPEEVTRFRAEAEAVARLRHPNIIHIYDIGEQDGRPYFAMELADAGSLADRLVGTPLRPEEAARLIEVLARAMYHAHLNGIVHRDLKPGNILLNSSADDSFPEIHLDGTLPGGSRPPLTSLVPKISDFGLAKRMDSKGRTVSGHVIGTVNYMAPEQAEGRSRDVGPCSDIYGLGAILYECLTGRPPFQAETLVATLELVRTTEPRTVRELNPSCPRDLETICHKCLEKDPERRYPSALDLAEDLKRFQAGEPIRARPVSTAEKIWRVLRRRRREAIWASCALSAVLILGGFLARQAYLKEQQQTQTRHRYESAVEALRRTRAVLLAPGKPPDPLAALLAELPRHYQQVQQKVEDHSLLEEAAGVTDELGEVLWKQGRKDEASDAGKVAMVLFRTLHEADPDRGAPRDGMARVRLRQGQIRAAFRDYDHAENEFRAALAELTQLSNNEKDNLDYRRRLAEAHHQLGVLLDARKRRREAVEAYQQALTIRQELAVARPRSREFRRDLARSHGYLGDTYLDLGEVKKSWDAYAEAERIRQQLSDENRGDPDALFQLARSHANEGYFGLTTGEVARALKGFEKARSLQEKLVVDHPGVADYASDLGWSLLNLIELKLDCDEPAQEVRELLQEAHALFAGILAASDADRSAARNLARCQVNQAVFLRDTHRDQAQDSLRRARDILARLTADDRQRQHEDPDDLYQLALVESLRGGFHSDEKKRWEHADQAMSYLDLAIRFGYTRATRLDRSVSGLRLLWQIDPRRMEALRRRCQQGMK